MQYFLPSASKKLVIRFLGVKRRITAHLGVSSARLGRGHGASRARSRTDVRLGRASRACSPPICTILRRLIKLVCALLRFRERSRTIEVQLTTLSAQNTRKISRPKLLGSVYPFVSLPAAHYKSFIFSFKISVIFVKLVC